MMIEKIVISLPEILRATDRFVKEACRSHLSMRVLLWIDPSGTFIPSSDDSLDAQSYSSEPAIPLGEFFKKLSRSWQEPGPFGLYACVEMAIVRGQLFKMKQRNGLFLPWQIFLYMHVQLAERLKTLAAATWKDHPLAEKRLYTTKEAAHYLGTTAAALRKDQERYGDIPVVGRGRALMGQGRTGPRRYDKKDLDKWIEKHKSRSVNPDSDAEEEAGR